MSEKNTECPTRGDEIDTDNLSHIIGLYREIQAREQLIACLEARKALLEKKRKLLDTLTSGCLH
jgi:hypothetical protein